ncbi:hypothetical protein Hanom_Chr12g01124561 [Helianthus anomalus]
MYKQSTTILYSPKPAQPKLQNRRSLVPPCWLKPAPYHIAAAQTICVMATSNKRVCGTLRVAIPLRQFFLKKA